MQILVTDLNKMSWFLLLKQSFLFIKPETGILLDWMNNFNCCWKGQTNSKRNLPAKFLSLLPSISLSQKCLHKIGE